MLQDGVAVSVLASSLHCSGLKACQSFAYAPVLKGKLCARCRVPHVAVQVVDLYGELVGAEWGDRGGFALAAVAMSVPSYFAKRLLVFTNDPHV